MPTLEAVREKIKANFPKQAQSRRELAWNRETATSIVSECGVYRISKVEDPENKGVYGFSLSLAATPTAAPKHLSGPFLIPKHAREAAQAHANGEPLQADLA